MKFSSSRFLVFTIAAILFITQPVSAQVVDLPDPNLENVVRETLHREGIQLSPDAPITQQDMERLTELSAVKKGITNLNSIGYAQNLVFLDLGGNQIQDVSPLTKLANLKILSLWNNQIQDIAPLAHLTNLTSLNLALNRVKTLEPLSGLIQLQALDLVGCKVKDISPLANLTNLTTLVLTANLIIDFSPLSNLINLEKLWIDDNIGTDITALQGLNLSVFQYDAICDIPPTLPPVRERIENRTFPAIFQAWDDVLGLDHLTLDQRSALHDLYFSPWFVGWDQNPTEPAEGIATSLAGNLARGREKHQRRLDLNPNMLFLFTVPTHSDYIETFPPNSDFLLKDENGEIIASDDFVAQINFLKPEVQDLLVKRIIAVERCGFYDGVMLDEFLNHGAWGSDIYGISEEEIIQAFLNIFRAVRSQARDDFLILINANRTKPIRYAAYVNGSFMETGSDNEYLLGIPGGYTHDGLKEIESTLTWLEQNLRSPQINCLEGWGIPAEPPDSPENQRWMRVITTLSLTHSDGYVMYNTGTGAVRVSDMSYQWGPGHEHIWYDFWDADLGRPVGSKAQHHQNIDGLFIREFTNGWAVYNRSGKAQTITLPASATPVSDRGNNAASQTHLLPDLDGEIYLKAKNPADVNGDSKINILDLVQVANGFGKSTPDPNGDGVVNILDLVFVAQQFSQ